MKQEMDKGKNPSSSNYLCQKFEREFRIVIDNMAKEEFEWEDSQPIPYQPCGSILTTLGFLPQSMSQESNDFKLFKDLWEVLDGNKVSSGRCEVTSD